MYEFTFLVNQESETEPVKKLVTDLGGKITEEKPWGEKRPLAYPVQNKKEAYYYTWYFDIDGDKIDELKQKLNFSNATLRYLILKTEK